MIPAIWRRRPFTLVPLVLVMGAIFLLSHLPNTSLSDPLFPHVDKLAHLIAYAALAASLLYALPETWHKWHLARISLLVVLFCLLYGISDEWHQSFVPGRNASAGDVLADVLGACLCMVIYGRWRQHQQNSRAWSKTKNADD